MRLPSLLRERSLFDSFEASRRYARTAATNSRTASFIVAATAALEGTAVISWLSDGDPTTRVTPWDYGVFAALALVTQICHTRFLQAEARRDEDWETFHVLQNQKIAAAARVVEQTVADIEGTTVRLDQAVTGSEREITTAEPPQPPPLSDSQQPPTSGDPRS